MFVLAIIPTPVGEPGTLGDTTVLRRRLQYLNLSERWQARISKTSALVQGRRVALEPFEKFKTLLYQDAGNYKALARWAFTRRDGEKYFLRGVIRLNPRTFPEENITRDYGNLVLTESVLGVDDVEKLATYLMEGDMHGAFGFRLQSGYAIGALPARWPSDWPAPIGQPERLSDWPHSGFIFTSKLGSTPNIAGPFAQMGLPPIIDPTEAIDQWIGANSSWIPGLQNALVCVIPDYRVRIREIKFAEDRVTVSLDAEPEEQNKLSVQITASVQGREEQLKIERQGLEFSSPTPGLPAWVYVFVFDGRDLRDWARIYPSQTALPSQVKFEFPELQLTQLIEGGESERVEFKDQLTDLSEFVESVVAFANSGNGIIFVGVRDDATITGVASPEKEEERIRNAIETHCEPAPPVKVEKVTLQDKDLLMVSVSEGTNPPYVHRTRGVVYVRRGGTDRPAKRGDLDEIYERRSRGGVR